ncbi:nibrin [Seriola aureovittata]|uniref:nibrin n=1 Tax=Seriola aureovittata TaxID=2871759 RepID=UPI0024BDB4A7|nr:nibrin [Seriola aureovittata]
MWILTPLQPGGETHYLLARKEYVVGRKNCDILLTNDQSISRAHAHLTATDQTLTLKDTSKYGTFVNGQRVAENTIVNLQSGDNVTFGAFYSKFSVDYQKPVVCSSCVDNDGKATLSQALLALGGKLVNTWTQDCTHLAMPTVKVTIKTISALLCCRPIVKPEYFSELNNAIQQKLPPPKPERFIPEIDEPSLSKEDVNLGVVAVRKQLFIEKTFIFLSAKQLKRLSTALSFGRGKSQLLEEGSLPRDLLESPRSCVVDVSTGSSQALLSSSTTEWANSVKNIVQRKGLRVITESEIGLAAIYASCDKYCNPSSQMPDSEAVPKVKPRIPSASLSQNVAVDETVLPAPSQNITAYAVNTEPSERSELCEVTGFTLVGETPEKKQIGNKSQHRGSKVTAEKRSTQCIVADTMSSSFNTANSTNSQRKKPESKLTVSGEGSSDIRSQPPTCRTNGGVKTFFQRQSPQKPRLPAQTSPQKQSTLTTFFQPVNKKRPLDDEFSTTMSEPKRPVLASSISRIQSPGTSVASKETYSRSNRLAAATSQTPAGSGVDLFTGRSEAPLHGVSHTVQEEPQSRKRKEMEEEIQLAELESIMSEDMDFFDEQPSSKQGKQVQLTKSSTEQKQGLNTVEPSSSSKRQRLHVEDRETNQRLLVGLEKETGSQKNNGQKSEQHIISIKTEQLDPSEYMTTNHESSKPPHMSSASTSKKNILPFEDDDASFIEDLDLLKADICEPEEETKTPLKPVVIKQEVQESKIDEDLPKKLVLVEFRSLTVTAPPKTKPKQMPGNGYAKNYKCFRKSRVPGAEGSPHFIGGSDLLVHNKGKNSDMDEWLKDAAEEERQSRRDETVGDDLFRYNPTKLTKRR